MAYKQETTERLGAPAPGDPGSGSWRSGRPRGRHGLAMIAIMITIIIIRIIVIIVMIVVLVVVITIILVVVMIVIVVIIAMITKITIIITILLVVVVVVVAVVIIIMIIIIIIVIVIVIAGGPVELRALQEALPLELGEQRASILTDVQTPFLGNPLSSPQSSDDLTRCQENSTRSRRRLALRTLSLRTGIPTPTGNFPERNDSAILSLRVLSLWTDRTH